MLLPLEFTVQHPPVMPTGTTELRARPVPEEGVVSALDTDTGMLWTVDVRPTMMQGTQTRHGDGLLQRVRAIRDTLTEYLAGAPATPPATRYEVVAEHHLGPAVVRGGTLVDTCPSVESAQRIAAALNELAFDGDLQWALPATQALTDPERDRVLRALAKHTRDARGTA